MFNYFEYMTNRLMLDNTKLSGTKQHSGNVALSCAFDILGEQVFNEHLQVNLDYAWKENADLAQFSGWVGEGFHKGFRQTDIYEGEAGPVNTLIWNLLNTDTIFWNVLLEIVWVFWMKKTQPDKKVQHLIRDAAECVEEISFRKKYPKN